jgi:hypothetical protein
VAVAARGFFAGHFRNYAGLQVIDYENSKDYTSLNNSSAARPGGYWF